MRKKSALVVALLAVVVRCRCHTLPSFCEDFRRNFYLDRLCRLCWLMSDGLFYEMINVMFFSHKTPYCVYICPYTSKVV